MSRALVVAFLALTGCATVSAQVWTPPAGIPAPTFGIEEQPGPVTLTLAPGAQPPNPMPAGTVMRLAAGTHNLSNRTWTAAGTAASPVFVVASPGATITGTSGFKLAGQYLIVDGLVVTNWQVQILAHHVALRNMDVSLRTATSGAIVSFGATSTDVVMYRNSIHDNGDKTVVGESDLHGIKISTSTPTVRRVWLIEHESWNNNGDSIQCGSATGGPPFPGELYIVGGHFRNEGENGVDVKRCETVRVHGVEINGMTNLRGDPGRGIVIHDGGTDFRVSNSFIHHNLAEGIVSTGFTGFEVDGNRIEDNGTGVRAYGGTTGDVHHNVLRRNTTSLNLLPPVTQHDNLINPPEGPNAPGAPSVQVEVVP